MQRFTLTLAVLATVAAVPALAFAAQPPLPNAVEAGKDLNQFRAARVDALMRMDADRDGRISQAEFAALKGARKQAAAPAAAGRGGKMFGRIDADHDGYLSRPEIERLAERRFRKLDANGDGQVVASERKAAHHGRGRGDTPGL